MKVNLRTRPLREVRKDRMVPGVMYGKSMDSTNIEVEDNVLKAALTEFGKSMTFAVTLDGKKHNVYIKHVVTNILRPNDIIHFEFHRIAADEKVSASIPVVITGREELEKRRLYIQMGLSDIDCEYLSGSGISSFDFDATGMEIDQAVHVSDIVVPEGVEILDELDQLVFIVKEAQQEEEEETDEVELDSETEEDEEENEEA